MRSAAVYIVTIAAEPVCSVSIPVDRRPWQGGARFHRNEPNFVPLSKRHRLTHIPVVTSLIVIVSGQASRREGVTSSDREHECLTHSFGVSVKQGLSVDI
ncbi:hypothetical protein CBL_05885 [Carabus blaptoides fortunei]